MLISNDFLKTRAGFAYVRECVKFGFDVVDAKLFNLDLYEVEITSYEMHGRMMVANIVAFVRRQRSFDGRYRIHKYNRSTCKYDCVYDGSSEVLNDWVTVGGLLVPAVELYGFNNRGDKPTQIFSTYRTTQFTPHDVFARAANNYNRVLCYNADPDEWKLLFEADPAFMATVCGEPLPF